MFSFAKKKKTNEQNYIAAVYLHDLQHIIL